MDFLTDWLTNWLKELLIGGIMGNLEGLFDTVNTQVGEIAAQVGTTPAAWHAGVFSLIRQLSETVILPIAGMVLTFVATYELIQMLLEKNNMHEVDVANLYKWMFKTACAILILSNTFNIVMAVFDVSQSVIAQAGGLIQGSTDVSADMLAELETSLEAMDLGPLLGLWLQSALIGFTIKAMGIIIFVLVYGRMLEIYLLTSLAPIPVHFKDKCPSSEVQSSKRSMKMSKKIRTEAVDQLFEAILCLKDKEECYTFFEDVCTINELLSLSQRFEVAKMLMDKRTYLDISEKTGASTATISRVNRSLNYGNDGYEMVFSRMAEKETKGE